MSSAFPSLENFENLKPQPHHDRLFDDGGQKTTYMLFGHVCERYLPLYLIPMGVLSLPLPLLSLSAHLHDQLVEPSLHTQSPGPQP